MIKQECNIITSKGAHDWRVARARNFPCCCPLRGHLGAKASDAGAFQEPAPAFIRVFQRTNADVQCNPRLITLSLSLLGTILFVKPLISRGVQQSHTQHPQRTTSTGLRRYPYIQLNYSTPQTHLPPTAAVAVLPFLLLQRPLRGLNPNPLFVPRFHSFVDSLFSTTSAATAWCQAFIHRPTVRQHHSSFRCRPQTQSVLSHPFALCLAWPGFQPSFVLFFINPTPPDGTFTGTFPIYKNLVHS